MATQNTLVDLHNLLSKPPSGAGQPPVSAPSKPIGALPGKLSPIVKYPNPEDEPRNVSFARNKPWSKQGQYTTKLSTQDEAEFQKWAKTNPHLVSGELDSPTPDYDVRGRWLAEKRGDPEAKLTRSPFDGTMHSSDKWKTPYDAVFSRESMYATPDAPHWEGDKLIDKHGNVIADETPTGNKKPEASGQKNSLANLHSLLSGRQPVDTPLAQRALEALPGGKYAEDFVQGQEKYWGSVGQRFKNAEEGVFGKPGHKGAAQRVLNEWKSDPWIQEFKAKADTPLMTVDLTGFGAPPTGSGGTPEQYKDYLRERDRRDKKLQQNEIRIHSLYRGLMEGVGDAVSGLTSPMNLALIFGTEGLGLEAKLGAREAAEAAKAEAGLATAGEGEYRALGAAEKAGKEAAEKYHADQKYAGSLAGFTANKAMSSLMSAGFTAQMAMGAWSGFKQAQAQFQAGDITGGTRSAVDGLVSSLFGLGSAMHTFHGLPEIHGAWKSEREVKAALETGAQEKFKQSWKDLNPDQKDKVLSDAVMKYGSEDAKQFQRQMAARKMAPDYGQILQTLEKESQQRFGKGWYELNPDEQAHMALDQENLWPQVDFNTPEGKLKAQQISQVMEGAATQGLDEAHLDAFRQQREARDTEIEGIKAPERGQQAIRHPADTEYEQKLGEYKAWEDQAEQDKAAGKGQSTDQYYLTEYGREPEWAPDKPEGYDQRQTALDSHSAEMAQQGTTRQDQAGRESAASTAEKERIGQAQQRGGAAMDAAYDKAEANFQWFETRRAPLEAKVRSGKRLTREENRQLMQKSQRMAKPWGYDERKETAKPADEQARNAQLRGLDKEAAGIYPKVQGAAPGTKAERVAASLQSRQKLGQTLSEEESAFLTRYDDFKNPKPPKPPPELTGVAKELDEMAAAIFPALPAEDRANQAYLNLIDAEDGGQELSELEKYFTRFYENREELEALENAPPAPVGPKIQTQAEKEETALRQLELERGRQNEPAPDERIQIDTTLRGTVEAAIDKAGANMSPEMAAYSQAGASLELLGRQIFPGLDSVEAAYRRILQSDNVPTGDQRLFLRLWNDRQTQLTRMAEHTPEIKTALEAANEAHATQSARELVDAVQDYRRMRDVESTLAGKPTASADEAAFYAERTAEARQMALGYRHKAETARVELGAPPQEHIPNLHEELGLSGETARIEPETFDKLDARLADTGKPLQELLQSDYGAELARNLLGERASQYLDEAGRLTQDGSEVMKRMLLERAIGERVDGIPEAVLDKTIPHLKALARLASGKPNWRLGPYLIDAMRDLGDMEMQLPALLRIGTETESVVDKYYRPLDFKGGEAVDRTPRPAPNRITEALAKTLLRGRTDALESYAHAEEGGLFTDDTPVSAFNRDVAGKVQMKVDELDFEQTEPVTPAERESEAQAGKPVVPTPAEQVQQANPTKVPAQIQKEEAEQAVVYEAQQGDVTPESLRDMLKTHPVLKDWADYLVHFFTQVVPKATGLSLAEFLKQQVSGFARPQEIKTEWGTAAAGFYDTATRILALGDTANAATLVHEIFHAMEPLLKAEDAAKLDIWARKVLKVKFPFWAEFGKDGKPDPKFLRELSEIKARGLERFLATGKIPETADPEIINIFNKLKTMVRGLYKFMANDKIPDDVPVNQWMRTKLSSEVEKVFESWFKRDKGGKPAEASPAAAPEAPVAAQAAPPPLEAVTPAKAPEAAPRAAEPVSGSKSALERERTAWAAFDAAKDKFEKSPLFDKPPSKMTPAERAKFNEYKALEKAANDASAAVQKLDLALPPIEAPPAAVPVEAKETRGSKEAPLHWDERNIDVYADGSNWFTRSVPGAKWVRTGGLDAQDMEDAFQKGELGTEPSAAKVQEAETAPPEPVTTQTPTEEPSISKPLTETQAEVARERAEPMLDIHRKPTGWLRADHDNGTSLIHPTENIYIPFRSADEKSGAAAMRAKAEAQAYAIDHPIEATPATVSAPGDLVIKPIFEPKAPAGELRQGKVGDMLADGEVVLTATGRKTTPFPKLDTTTNRKTGNTLKRVDQWLMDNAVEEAKTRGDEFNLRQFEQNRKKPSPADKDSAEMYLFDKDSIQPVRKPLLKPPAAPPESAPKELAPPPEPYGEPLVLTPFEGFSDRQLWDRKREELLESARTEDDREDANFDAFVHVMNLQGVVGKDAEGALNAFLDTVNKADSWQQIQQEVGQGLKEVAITGDDDGMALAKIARRFLKGDDLFKALANIADQLSGDPEAARKRLLSMDELPPEADTIAATDGRPEDQPEGTAGGAENLSSIPEPPRQGGDAPTPVPAEGDQAAQGGEGARPDAGRADAERVEHAGGQPEERLGDGSGAGGSAAADPAAKRAGARAGKTGRTGADGQPVETPRPEKPRAARAAAIRNRNNYHISDEYAAAIGSGGEITKIRGNLDALELLKKLQAEGRETATPEEQAILAKYVDFGGLVGMLQNHWKPEYKDHYERFTKLLTPAEIQEIRETLPNTHYTSLQMVDWMWKAMQKMGLKGGRILEPGMGIGNFYGRIPMEIGNKAELYGVERNPLTGAMAKLLYPDARIMVKPFQQVMFPDNSLDSIIGNVPFQDFAVTDDPIYRKLKLNLHNYFIVKSLDKLRPGGIAALITSRYTMDNGTGLGVRAREEMAKRADLIAAFRLPDKAFKGNAGTEVVADLLIFRKRAADDIPEGVPDWTKLEKITVPGEEPVTKTAYGREYVDNFEATKAKDFHISKYFVDHPENVLGNHSKEGRMYGPGQYTVKAPEDFLAALNEAMNRVPAKAFGKVKESEANQTPETLDPGEMNFAPEDVKPGSFYKDESGNILVKESGVGKKLPMGLNTPAAKDHIGHAIDLREQLNQLIHTQLSTSDDGLMRDQQKVLDRLYEKYRGKYGSLHGPELRKVFGDDPEYPKLLALENLDPETKTVSKADIFSKRVLAPYEPLRDLPDDPKSAMLKVMAEKGGLDTALMADLLKKPEEEVIANLEKEGLIYREPRSGGYSTADEYLSGQVREKLRQAREAADLDPKYKANVEALEKVQPTAVTIHEIQPSLGQTWIPTEIYQGFVQYLANGLHRDSIGISRDVHTGKWLVQIDAKNVTHALKNKWGTSRVAGHKLVQFAMNQQLPTVWDVDSDGSRHVNREATLGARDKLSAIKEEFRTVLRRAKPEVIENLEQIYNDTFGGYRLREFSGEHLTFPGMSADWQGKIRGYQKASVWRILQEGGGGIFHAPGLGKTLTMAAAGMEARRLKLSRKNMYAVPNHMIPQWREDFKKFYPNANVLAATDQDFTAENRNKLMSRIATGDWDAVLVPHSQFDTLPMSPEWEMATIHKRLDEYRSVLQELDDERTIKQIEKAMDKLESRLNELNAKKKDNTINFDQLGVDMLFVDEAHLYKSMAVPTKMSGIGGIATSASQRAFALEMKGDYLRQTHSGRGLVFGTGTPITNTIGELYIMNKYLAPEMLEEAGVRSFDDWVANFAQTRTEYEYSADGVTFKPKTTLAEFVNVPELSTMFRRFAEYLSKDAARALSNLKEPEAKRFDHTVKITPVQEPLMDWIAQRGQSLIDHPPKTAEEKKADNWLKLSSDARKISLDPRLYDPTLKDHPDSKVNKSVEQIKKVLDASKAKKGTVVVFSDFFQHLNAAGKPDFNVYEDMRGKLVKKGIPKDQIAIIHEAGKREEKEALFAKVRAGKVRVIFGSTDKMGIGTNIQDLLKAEFHLDQPWRPDQVEQREGRIIRSGNQWEEVEIHRLIAEPETGKRLVWDENLHKEVEQDRPRAYDLQMYQQLARKASFQEQFLTGNYGGRTMEDTGGDVKLNSQMFALGKAMATGNPDALRKLKLETDLRTFELLQRNHQTEVWRNTSTLNYRTLNLASTKAHLAKVQEKIATFKANTGRDKKEGWLFTLDIGKDHYKPEESHEVVNATNLEDLVGKSIRIAGLKTDIEVEAERWRPDEKHWDHVETRANVIYTDPSGEKRAVVRLGNQDQTLKALVSAFLRRADELPKDERSDIKRIPELEKEIQDLAEELEKPSPYADRLAAMQQEIAEIDQRLGIARVAHDDEVAVEDEEPEKGGDKLYQEETPKAQPLSPEEEQSELVSEDGDLQGHMAEAQVKRFPSVEEAKDWLVETAQGDQYPETFHGSQIRQMPAKDGEVPKAVVVYAPAGPSVLYQDIPPEMSRERLKKLRDEAEYMLRIPRWREANPKEVAQKQAFIADANKRLGDRPGFMPPPPPNVDAKTGPGKVESQFPAEAKDAGSNSGRAASDDHRGVRDAGRVPPVASGADRPGGAGEAGRAGLRAGSDRGVGDLRGGREGLRGRGVPQAAGGTGPVDAPLPYIRMKMPTRRRGAGIATDAQWKAHAISLGIPVDTPAPTTVLADPIIQVLSKYKGQREQAEVVDSALEQFDGAILASGTGGGKTYISLGVARQRWTPESRQFIVTLNRAIINQRSGWKEVGQRYYGLDISGLPGRKSVRDSGVRPGTYVGTYAELLKRSDMASIPWDLVIFDEAATARRWYDKSPGKTNQGQMAKRLSDVAKKAIYVSAAPYHNAVEMGWMSKLGVWEPGQFDEWASQLGARKGKNKWKRGKNDPDETWSRFGSDPRKLMAVREALIKRGQFATQTISQVGHSTDIALVQTSEHQRLQVKAIRGVFQQAEELYKKQPQRAKRARALGAIYTKNYLERLKIPQMIELVKEARKQGWDVAMFSENKTGVRNLWNYLAEANKATVSEQYPEGKLKAELPELPDVFEQLEKGLGAGEVANYSGSAGGSRSRMAESFRSGEKHYLYATYAAGGVGVSFHDDSEGGVRPKLVIHLGLPWSGMMFNQAQGRFWRYGTESNVHSIFLVGDAKPEVDLILNKVMPRLNSIHASVRGLDNQDPLVRGMQKLSKAEAYAYDLGYKAKYDVSDYTPADGSIPIRDWTHAKAHLPSAEEAKGKGMQYPKNDDANPIQNKLFQEEAPKTPPRFLSPEEAQARVDAYDLMHALEEGEPVPELEGEAAEIDPGDRQIAAERHLPAVEQKIVNRGGADPKAVARRAGRTAMANIRAAKIAGDIEMAPEAKEGDPQWKMTGKTPPKVDEKAKSKRFRLFDAILSGMENIRSMTRDAGVAEIGQEIDLRNRNFHAWKNQYSGELQAEALEIVKDNQLKGNEIDQMWAVKEGKASSSNPRILRAAQALTRQMDRIHDMAAARGVNLSDWDESTGEKLKIGFAEFGKKPNYMPHIFDYAKKIQVKDPRTGEELTFTLKQLLADNDLAAIKKDRIISAIAADRKIARSEVENWIDSKRRKTPLAGNLERARKADLPFYRTDMGALFKYYAGVGEVFARTEQFGQDLEKLDDLIKQVPDTKARKNIKNIMTDAIAPAPWDEPASRFYSLLTTGAVTTKMVFSPIKVPFHLIHTGLVLEQFRPMLKAILQSATNYSEIRQRLIQSGALADGVNAQVNMELASKMKASHLMLKYTGFNWLYQFDRIVAGQTSRNWMGDHALPELIRKSKNSARIREQLKETMLLTDSQIDAGIQRGRWTEDDFKHAASAFTNRVMFTSDSTEMPYLSRMRAPEYPMIDNFAIAVRAAFALKSFMFKTSMLLKRSVFDEAKKGNFKPMAMFFLAYPLAGAALRMTSAGVHAATGSPAALKKQEQDWDEIFTDPSIGKLAHEWVDDMGGATALTMFSHILDVVLFPPKDKRKKQFQREQLPWDVGKEVLGPYGDVADIFKTLLKMSEAGVDDIQSEDRNKLEKLWHDEGKPALDTTGEVLPALRPAVPWAESKLGLTKKTYEMAPPP